MTEHYDIIIIGTGAGGGTLAHRLAPSGKKILIIERGTFLPREKANWNPTEVMTAGRYYNAESWQDKEKQELNPATGYWVGGNTKFFGGTLFRAREREFDPVIHKGGISPEWCLKYADFEPYYTQAGKLYNVHGKRGLDPIEPWTTEEYSFPPISHEPRIQAVSDDLSAKGLHPFYLPMAIKLNEAQQFLSECIRCETCDGHPCMVHAKADAEVMTVLPTIQHPNVTLLTGAKVQRLHTSASGREITGVETEIAGEIKLFRGDIVVVAGGAINSAVLLLRSTNDQHPDGLANSSGQVGRNFMKHNCGVVIETTAKANPTVFQKTLGVNDFYWGKPDFPYPMGQIQLSGKVNREMFENGVPLRVDADISPANAAAHSVDWWLMGEDLPDPHNRVSLKGDKISLEYTDNNSESFDRLVDRWIDVLKSIDSNSRSYRSKFPLRWVAHQCGTCRFGTDAKMSVLDPDCRTTAEEIPAQTLDYPASQADMNPQPDSDLSNYSPAGKLQGKVALITGGDSGIGRAVAIAYAMEGADVAIVYNVHDDDANITKALVEEKGQHCLTIKADVRDSSQCKQAVTQTIDKFKHLDILVNNAGYQKVQFEIEDISDEQFQRTMETNIFGYFYMLKAALPHLKEGDAIINTSSILGLIGKEFLVDYSASKGAINAFTKATAQNLVNVKFGSMLSLLALSGHRGFPLL